MIRRCAVFCGSHPGARPSYAAAAATLARCLVANGIGIVYGGGGVGLMGALADAALAQGGEVIGVIPKALVERELAHRSLTDLHVVGTMHERKAMMADLADAFIAMPGGFGTLDEFCEILTWTQLGWVRKPCGVLNVDGYFDRLLDHFDHSVAEEFVRPEHRAMIVTDDNAESLIARMRLATLPRL
jgi:uncharacterized protein (TIGR00730 family)